MIARFKAKLAESPDRGHTDSHGNYTPCLEFQGYRDDDNYDQFKLDGKAQWAHRVGFAIDNGDIPGRTTVDHRCHNHACCRGEHLRLRGHVDNCRDQQHGRAVTERQRAAAYREEVAV